MPFELQNNAKFVAYSEYVLEYVIIYFIQRRRKITKKIESASLFLLFFYFIIGERETR